MILSWNPSRWTLTGPSHSRRKHCNEKSCTRWHLPYGAPDTVPACKHAFQGRTAWNSTSDAGMQQCQCIPSGARFMVISKHVIANIVTRPIFLIGVKLSTFRVQQWCAMVSRSYELMPHLESNKKYAGGELTGWLCWVVGRTQNWCCYMFEQEVFDQKKVC